MLHKEEGNNIISKFIEENNNFALSRIGLSELRWVDWFIRDGLNSNCDNSYFCGQYFTPTFRDRLKINGIYGDSYEYFMSEYIKGISCADIQVEWHVEEISNQQKNIFNTYSKDSIKIHIESLVPYMHTNFWSKKLENKKVLIVYPFVETIKMQYQKKEKIWLNEHKGKLPKFELITYKPFWALGNDLPHSSWRETLTVMKEDITKLNFDIAILGCSHYGLPLVSHIKEIMGKSAIYMGGETQILFGIKGKRWDNWEGSSSFYNEDWTRQIDIIYDSINLMDDGCYL